LAQDSRGAGGAIVETHETARQTRKADPALERL
jgi:hypothetical protein